MLDVLGLNFTVSFAQSQLSLNQTHKLNFSGFRKRSNYLL